MGEGFPNETHLFNEERRAEFVARWNDAVGTLVNRVASLARVRPEAQGSPTEMLEALTKIRLEEQAKGTHLIVISSVAGGGKSTVGGMLEQLGWERLPRVTTRAPRPGEREGTDYEFLTPDAFEEERRRGAFAYTKDTYGESRAIRTRTVEAVLQGDRRFYVEGDALAYDNIRKTFSKYNELSYCSVFLLPPSGECMLERLIGRVEKDIANGTPREDAYREIPARLEAAIHYLTESGKHIESGVYHGFMVNDRLDRVLEQLSRLFS